MVGDWVVKLVRPVGRFAHLMLGRGRSMPAEIGKQRRVLEAFRVDTRTRLFLIGTFDDHVTVFSQQVRALNLAWALIESGEVPSRADGGRMKIAVVGAGFTGLTFVAGLLKKHAAVDVTVFEERDTLIPLQQGSDSRWLHPHIYDWPEEGSEASVAMLPVLNWRAARASDVVVEVLAEWERSKRDADAAGATVRLFCNTRHLQIAPCAFDRGRAEVEWVAEERDPWTGTDPGEQRTEGTSEAFDMVVLAVGFGLEVDNPSSYWRNETLGQPSLNQPRRTFIVSGQGDGAMIDLLRLRVSQYRQDRILAELFHGKSKLLDRLKELRTEYKNGRLGATAFQRLEALCAPGAATEPEVKELIGALKKRLRRDTDVILRMKVRSVAELLDTNSSRMSFQNAVLVYLLYKCGGFAPSSQPEDLLRQRLALRADRIVRRHGTKRAGQLERLLSDDLYRASGCSPSGGPPVGLKQTAEIAWSGGYFGFRGRSSQMQMVRPEDPERKEWRKEYLPGATELFAQTLCSAVSAIIATAWPAATDYRVTLHRVLPLHGDVLLQQGCDYAGLNQNSAESTAGRTFPSDNATIGAAFSFRKIIRAKQGVSAEQLLLAMRSLELEEASSAMRPGVTFVLAVPIVRQATRAEECVVAILYVDSRDPGLWLDDQLLATVCRTLENAFADENSLLRFGRIRNVPLKNVESKAIRLEGLPDAAADALEILLDVRVPSSNSMEFLNLDYSDVDFSAEVFK